MAKWYFAFIFQSFRVSAGNFKNFQIKSYPSPLPGYIPALNNLNIKFAGLGKKEINNLSEFHDQFNGSNPTIAKKEQFGKGLKSIFF